MRKTSVAALGFVLVLLATGSHATPASEREIRNVAAFARAYGVLRYFYPSDAAAGLDWNRLAVHGVARVRGAGDDKSLGATLQGLFLPLGPGIEIGTTLPPPRAAGDTSASLVAWRYLGAGIDEGGGFTVYSSNRTGRSSAVLDRLLGKTVRMRAQVRATARDDAGWAALWLRVDRPSGAKGFFDNMADRRIRESRWHEYSIEGVVAEDATALNLGVMASGPVTADFDAIELCVRTSDGCTPVPIRDAGFEAVEASRYNGWLMRGGTSKTALITRLEQAAPEGRQFLRFEPPAGGSIDGFVSVAQAFRGPDPFLKTAATPGDHVEVDLGANLKLRVRLALSDAEAGADESRSVPLEALRRQLGAVGDPSPLPDLDRRLADVIVAWNVFRHFYPYWAEAGLDWDARLRPLLEAAHAADTRATQRAVIRQLVADARDGHGSVNDTLVPRSTQRLPVDFGVVEGKLVIIASATPEAAVGSVIAEIDGVPANHRLDEEMRLISGSQQWKQASAMRQLTSGAAGATLRLGLDDGTSRRDVTLRFESKQPPPETRPATVSELAPGLWYVDLTRARMPELTSALETLSRGRGVVFDVRGYPTEAGSQLLGHLVAEPVRDRWMHVAQLLGPFGRAAGWRSSGWYVDPTPPRIAGKVAFLTDARAISYAESVMGFVGDLKLGTILGGATAGTNGNVASFTVPSGFSVVFTGMRVTRHDGQTPFHLIGVQPDIPVEPTISGLRAGRDEVLERALALIRGDAAR